MIGTRECTKEEIKIYEKVEKALENLTEKEFEALIYKVGDFVFDTGKERKKSYDKCRPIAKKYNVTVLELETWYCIETFD